MASIKQIAIRIDEAWANQIKSTAAKHGMSQQALIEAALQNYDLTRWAAMPENTGATYGNQ